MSSTRLANLLEAQRLEERTGFDLEIDRETGRCKGIENYSRHLSGREGEPPPRSLSFFQKNGCLIVDESHVTVPQVGGMFKGDRSRKETLVDHGFRLPSALDNRPLKFRGFEALLDQVVYVSATPKVHEIEKAEGVVVEQIIRPTGLLDPVVEVRPIAHQVDDLLAELRKAAGRPTGFGDCVDQADGTGVDRLLPRAWAFASISAFGH